MKMAINAQRLQGSVDRTQQNVAQIREEDLWFLAREISFLLPRKYRVSEKEKGVIIAEMGRG